MNFINIYANVIVDLNDDLKIEGVYKLKFRYLLKVTIFSNNRVFLREGSSWKSFEKNFFCFFQRLKQEPDPTFSVGSRPKIYPILKTITDNGGKTNAAENSRPFQDSASIFIGLAFETPLPAYIVASELKISVNFPFVGTPIL